MKKISLFIITMALATLMTFAQTPDAFNYQAVARTSSGAIMATQSISVEISIMESGSAVYTETHDVTTNQYGLFTLQIGGGTSSLGNFSTIDWSNGTYSVQTAMDENGGSNYIVMGTSPLLTVPFAMHAKTAENTFSGNYNDLSNTPDLSNYETDASDDFSGNYADLNGTPTLTGDVTGDIDNNTVSKIQGKDVSANIPANDQVLKWNDAQQAWLPADDALGAAGSTDGVVNSVGITGTTTKTVTLTRSNGLGVLTATFDDENTQLTETEVDAMVNNNGYLTSFTEVDGSTTNEIQSLTLTGTTLGISDGNTVNLSTLQDGYEPDTDTHLSEAEVDAMVNNNGYLTSFTEVDGSTTNELQDLSLSGTTLSITNGTNASFTGWDTNAADDFSGNYNDLTNKPTLGGDVSGDIDFNTVERIQGRNVTSAEPANGQVLKWDDGLFMWVAADDNTGAAGTSDGVASTVNVTGTTTKTITIERTEGLGDITANFTDANTQLTETDVDAMVNNNGYLTSFTEVDGSTTNELQDLSLSGTTLSIENGNNVDLSGVQDGYEANTDNQTLAFYSGTILAIQNGNTVNLASLQDGTGTDDQKIDYFAVSGNTLYLSIEGDGQASKFVDLSGINTDTQLSEAEVDAMVSNNGYLTSETDGSTTNELQDLSLTGNTLSIENGNSVDLSSIGGSSNLSDILTEGNDGGASQIKNIADPTAAQDAATKKYVDDEIAGVSGGATDRITSGTNSLIISATDLNFKYGFVNKFRITENTISTDFPNNNLQIGENSGLSRNSNAWSNTSLGDESLNSLTEGMSNTAIGYRAGKRLTDSGYNTFVGSSSGSYMNGSANTVIGFMAGQGTAANTAYQNTYLGYKAGRQSHGNNNVFIGHEAGYYETGNNKFYLANSKSINEAYARTSALIYGDFSTSVLNLNATVTINDNYTLPSVDGTDKQIISTNGSGDLSWTDYDPQFVDKNGVTTNAVPSAGNGNNDFVFGSSQLDRSMLASENKRMFFDKSKAAFRVGYVYSTVWDEANVGDFSFAAGYETKASDFATVALGYKAYATANGAFAFGDHSSGATILTNSTANSFKTRFAGGYVFYTNKTNTIGVSLAANANSWSTISDSTKKENFKVIDGELLLNKISEFNLTSWNYKGQDASKYRHYGPMAQDFYSAFGNDGVGTIGCDTLLSSADFMGINFTAIQALEKRTQELKEANSVLEAKINEIEKLKAKQNILEAKINEFDDIKNQLNEIKQYLEINASSK